MRGEVIGRIHEGEAKAVGMSAKEVCNLVEKLYELADEPRMAKEKTLRGLVKSNRACADLCFAGCFCHRFQSHKRASHTYLARMIIVLYAWCAPRLNRDVSGGEAKRSAPLNGGVDNDLQ